MDPIADMLSQILNAGKAGKQSVSVPHSKVKMAIAKVLLKEGYISSAQKKEEEDTFSFIEMGIVYSEKGEPKITKTNRISKTSRRVYRKSKNLKPVKNNYGILVLSTPKGIMDSKSARDNNVGGEELFAIW